MVIVRDTRMEVGNAVVARFVVNTIRENTYLLFFRDLNPATGLRDGIVIDCGAWRPQEKERIGNFIAANHIAPRFHLLTHAHFDHLMGARWLYDNFHITPYFLSANLHIYRDAQSLMRRTLHLTEPLPLPPSPMLVDDGFTATISQTNPICKVSLISPISPISPISQISSIENARPDISLRFISVPGHTWGSAALFDFSHKILFTGDAVFRDYDTIVTEPGLTLDDARRSARHILASMPKDTLVLPGHGPEFRV